MPGVNTVWSKLKEIYGRDLKLMRLPDGTVEELPPELAGPQRWQRQWVLVREEKLADKSLLRVWRSKLDGDEKSIRRVKAKFLPGVLKPIDPVEE